MKYSNENQEPDYDLIGDNTINYGESELTKYKEDIYNRITRRVNSQFTKIVRALSGRDDKPLVVKDYEDFALDTSDDGNYLILYKGYVVAIIKVDVNIHTNNISIQTIPFNVY